MKIERKNFLSQNFMKLFHFNEWKGLDVLHRYILLFHGTYSATVYIKTKDDASNQVVKVHSVNYTWGQKDKHICWNPPTTAELLMTLEDGSKIWDANFISHDVEYYIEYIGDDNGKNYEYQTLGTSSIAPHRTSESNYIRAILRNYAYDKDVQVRYTIDNWNSYQEYPMHYEYIRGEEWWEARLPIKIDESRKIPLLYQIYCQWQYLLG